MSVCPAVCSPARMEQLGYHCTDFYYIWYLSIYQISAEKIPVSLKCDKNNGYFTWRPLHFSDISLNIS